MSVKNLGFPLPVKIEEDQKLFIDLDTEGNSPEDIVIEWHLEMRRFFGSYSADSGEIKLISIMKEYITAITERAIHFEDIVRLQDMVDNHMEHIYWFYRDSDICFSDMYLDYMEHILTFYVNLTLRVLLVLKKKIKVTQKKVNDMTQKVIKRLSFYLLKSEYHIFHVLIRQTTTLVDGMIKDVMNILNSNICKQMFRNLYMHFLVLTPVRDMSDEAFCRAYILFENWKAFEDYKQNEKIEECIKNIFNRDMRSVRENEFLRKILMPESSIMSELMKVMGCNPSITKAYFDFIKSKQKEDTEIIDDIGKLALEDALLSETELTDEDDYETSYMEIFDKIMGDAKYNLDEIVLNTGNCKDEEILSVPGENAVNGEVEILISDTDSDSDVEIVSIVPSLNTSRQVTNTTRRTRNSVASSQPTSFLESISIEVDTSRRKYGFRNLGNTDSLPPKKSTDAHQTETKNIPEPSTAEDHDSDLEVIVEIPLEPCLIIDDDIPAADNTKEKDQSSEKCTIQFASADKSFESVCDGNLDKGITETIPDETINNGNSDEKELTVSVECTEDDHIESPVSKNCEQKGNNEQSIPEETINNQNRNETEPTGSVECTEVDPTESVVTEICNQKETNEQSILTRSEAPTKNCETQQLDDAENMSIEMHLKTGSVECTEVDPTESIVTEECNQKQTNEQSILTGSDAPTKNCETQQLDDAENMSIEMHLNALSITSESTTENASRTKNGYRIPSVQVNGTLTINFEQCQTHDRTLKGDKKPEVCECRTEPHSVESMRCESGCGNDETVIPVCENNVNYSGIISVTEQRTNVQSEGTTPLDTGQDLFMQPLDTGQFDANSPASPDIVDINLNSPCEKNEVNMIQAISEPPLIKGQHGEFGYPTPPGSEEERDKESSYEQIVKKAVGSQNSTEDEEDETHIISKDKDHDIGFDEMEQFLNNCDTEDYPQSNRKRRKRPREKAEDNRSRKNSFTRSSPKRVKINEKPETHFITMSSYEDSKDDIFDAQDSNDYNSSSSSEEDEMDSSRHRVKATRRPSPMPPSKYLSKRNGTITHVPLSGRFSPDKPPPLKGILKRIEQKHTYHPLHPVDDEPETVIIVLHQQEVGRGKRGSVEVKVYRKSFSTFRIPFDDHKLCHHAFVKVNRLPSNDVVVWDKVFDRTRNFEEEIYNQPEKPMYKIVFDKQTPQLNSNDRKYYCDPSISSNSSANTKLKSTLFEKEQGTVNLSSEIPYIETQEAVESITQPAIQAPISPPCFSPSSNSSSEFSNPTNLIPYQDIERALQVVEPEKSGEDAPCFSLESNDFNDGLEKSLVDRLALETIELLSNNADFHKMLRDFNGEVLIENVSLFGMNVIESVGNVTVVPEIPPSNDDLVSNLNSDEQLLKKVCQELESEELVDNLTRNPTNPMLDAASFLEVDVEENLSEESNLIIEMSKKETEIDGTEVESDQSFNPGRHEMQVSFPEISNNAVSIHSSFSSIENTSIPTAYSETNYNAPVTVNYSPPTLTPISDSSHLVTFSSVPDLIFTHSGQTHSSFSILNSPTVTPKHSPPIISPVPTFHQDQYSSVSPFPSNQTTNPDTNMRPPHSATLSRNSSALNETDFSNSSPLVKLSAPPISPIPNTLHRETYSSIPDSSLIHSSYSEIVERVATPSTVYSASNSPHQALPSNTEIQSFLPDPPVVGAPVHTEDMHRCTSSTLHAFTKPNSTISASSLFVSNIQTKSYIHNLPSALPTYTETNSLIPSGPLSHPYTEKEDIASCPPANVPPHPKTNESIFHKTQANVCLEPSTSISSLGPKLAFSPDSEMHSLRSSSRFHPNFISITHSFPPSKILQTKTDRRRLPKEVLTISQLNESKSSNKDCKDNNSKQSTSIYPANLNGFAQIRGNMAQHIDNTNRRFQNIRLTDELCKNTLSRDPRLGQPLICVPPPFIQGSERSNLLVNLPVPPETLKELAYKKSLLRKNKCPPQKYKKLPIMRAVVADKSLSKETQALRKFVDTATTLKAPIADSASSRETSVEDVVTFLGPLKNVADSAEFQNVTKNVPDSPAFKEISKNNSVSTTSFNDYENVANTSSILGASKKDPPTLPFLEGSVNVAYSKASMEKPMNNVHTIAILVEPENVSHTAGTFLGVPINTGARKKRSYVRKSTKSEPDTSAKPFKRGRAPTNVSIAKVPTTPKKQRDVSCNRNPANLEEALSTYADFYRKEEEEALLEENSNNKARNLHRIIKRFEEAIKQLKSGKQVDIEKLPVPPGFSPFITSERETKTAPTSDRINLRSESYIPKFHEKPKEFPVILGLGEIAGDINSLDNSEGKIHSGRKKPKLEIRKSSRDPKFPKHFNDFR